VTALGTVEVKTWGRLAPPPRLSIAQWADRERVLPPESSAEPGRWKTSRVPYLKTVMESITDRQIETIVLMASSQVGKTEVALNVVGYHIHLDPCPMMLIEPTIEIAAAVAKDRIAPMLRAAPALQGLVGVSRAKDASNSVLHKSFPGGHLTLAGANSPSSLASRPIRILLADEVDRWPATAGDEGDPLALAIRRTSTFQRRKIIITSSPTIEGGSRIADWWAISDQRRYHTPCPACGAPFVLEWHHVRYDNDDPNSARIECPTCHAAIDDAGRAVMVARGEWRASAPFAGVAGFHVWELLAPWRSLRALVASFLVHKRSLEMRQTWANTVEGRTWEGPGETADPTRLLARRETYYPAELPLGVVAVTCGVDVQDDRLELLVCGWSAEGECWIIARDSLPGDPARPEVWTQLDAVLARRWEHANGVALTVQCLCIDSAGHRTQFVYDYVIPRQVRQVHAIIGRVGGGHQLVSPPRPIKPASGRGLVQLRTVDVDQAKSILMSRLRVTVPGPDYVHVPMVVDEECCAQLTAEKLVTERDRGVPVRRWVKTRPRNDALDAFVYNFAAFTLIRWQTPTWARQLAEAATGASAPTPVTVQPRRAAQSPYLQRHGW